jgi:hypothetical protein
LYLYRGIIPEGTHFLGDSAYNLRDSMMIPFNHDNCSTHYRRRYNKLHAQTRNRVECAFGALKGRFPILKTELSMDNDGEDGVLIAACVALHNWCIRHESDSMGYLKNVVIDDEFENDLVDRMLDHKGDDPIFNPVDKSSVGLQQGRNIRSQFVAFFFNKSKLIINYTRVFVLEFILNIFLMCFNIF